MTNGEKFKTAEERHKAYALYCESMRGMNLAILHDTFEWLELEYSIALRVCPFCGGEAVLHEGECSFVKCHDCDAESFHGESSDEVVAAWNRREQ